jgi:hypothetical protein
MKRSLERIRSDNRPRTPTSILEAHTSLLETEKYRYYYYHCTSVFSMKLNILPKIRLNRTGSNKFFASAVNGEYGAALIFLSYELLPAFMESKTIFIDGTFRVVPKIFYQLVSIHFLAFNKVTIAEQLLWL